MNHRRGGHIPLAGKHAYQQVVAGDSRCFRFDHVFGVDSAQEEVYRRTTQPLVERCLDGFNATVLAYGQTGSGKTWTVGNAYTVRWRTMNGIASVRGGVRRVCMVLQILH